MNKEKMIILTGPTAVGKTELSIQLAKEIGGEIISADSMQVYREMNIGTAKITKEEMQGVRHHLIDCLDPDEEFNVAIFQKLAKEAVADIAGRGKVPILTGGTAFYIQALLYGIDFNEEEHDDSYRNAMYDIGVDEEGKKKLHAMLCEADKEYADTVHYNNMKRVVRALEYNHYTGRKFSEYNEQQRARNAEYDFCYFILNDERVHLYDRINKRVDIMVANGLVEEVKSLRAKGYADDLVSMQGVGYKEIVAWLNGAITLEESIELIKKNTRHFAKRQITWFRKEADVIWVDKQDYEYNDDEILEYMFSHMNRIGIYKI